MRLPFSGRYAKLETMNGILTDAARKRTERIEELERQVAQLKEELESARKAIEGARELEAVAAQRAHLLNEKDEEIGALRETLTKRALRIQELERQVTQTTDKLGGKGVRRTAICPPSHPLSARRGRGRVGRKK